MKLRSGRAGNVSPLRARAFVTVFPLHPRWKRVCKWGCMCVSLRVFPLQLVYHHSVNGDRVAVIWFWCLNAETQKQSSNDGTAPKTNRPKNKQSLLVSELVVTCYRCDTGSLRNMSAFRMSICSDFTRATYCCPILCFSSTTKKVLFLTAYVYLITLLWLYSVRLKKSN